MIFNSELLRIHNHTQIAVVGIIVILEGDGLVVHRLKGLRSSQRHAARSVQFLDIVSAIAADYVGYFGPVRAVPRKALVGVRVPRENGMWPYSDLLADRVHLLTHLGAGRVLTADGIGRMMVRK